MMPNEKQPVKSKFWRLTATVSMDPDIYFPLSDSVHDLRCFNLSVPIQTEDEERFPQDAFRTFCATIKQTFGKDCWIQTAKAIAITYEEWLKEI